MWPLPLPPDLPSAPPMDSSSIVSPMDLVLLPLLPMLLLLVDRYDDRRRMDGIRFFFAFFDFAAVVFFMASIAFFSSSCLFPAA